MAESVAATVSSTADSFADPFWCKINCRHAVIQQISPDTKDEYVVSQLRKLRTKYPSIHETLQEPDVIISGWRVNGTKTFNLPMSQAEMNARMEAAHADLQRLVALPEVDFENEIRHKYGDRVAEDSKKFSDKDLSEASRAVVSLISEIATHDIRVAHRNSQSYAFLKLPSRAEIMDAEGFTKPDGDVGIEYIPNENPLCDDENRRALLNMLKSACRELSPQSTIGVQGTQFVRIDNPSEELRDVFRAIHAAQKQAESSLSRS